MKSRYEFFANDEIQGFMRVVIERNDLALHKLRLYLSDAYIGISGQCDFFRSLKNGGRSDIGDTMYVECCKSPDSTMLILRDDDNPDSVAFLSLQAATVHRIYCATREFNYS